MVEQRQRILGDGAVMAGTRYGVLDGAVLRHQRDGLVKIVFGHLASLQRALPERALAVGAAVGPLTAGVIADRFGIIATFYFLAATIVFANLFILITPAETRKKPA